MTVYELRQARAKKIREAGEVLDKAVKENRAMTGQEEQSWKKLHSEADELRGQIDRAEGTSSALTRQRELEQELREPATRAIRPMPEGSGRRTLAEVETDEKRFVGRDKETGKIIRAVLPSESFAEKIREAGKLGNEYQGLSVGACVRSMLSGPRTEAERRALGEGTSAGGGYTVPTLVASDFIDVMRALNVVMQAGAQTIPIEGPTNIARLGTDVQAFWHAENTADFASADPTFEAVSFAPKTLISSVTVSRELLEDSVNADAMITGSLAKALGGELDRVSLIGSGSGQQPKGISTTSGVGSYSMGTNGAALTNYDPFLEICQTILDANGKMPTAFVLPPRTWKKAGQLKDTQNNPLRVPDAIAGIPRLVSQKLPVTETQGGSNASSRIITGDFSQLLIGIRTDLRLEIYRETNIKNFQTIILAYMRVDVQLAHPAAFGQIIGVL